MKPLRLSISPFCFALGWLLAGADVAIAEPALTTSAKLIERLHMAKIPSEGAWFAVTYQSMDRLPAGGLPARYGSSRLAGTAIYALITRPDFSAMHRLKTDEIWHFYSGNPIELLVLYSDGRSEIVVLGADVLAGQKPQFTVPAGTWMGARPLDISSEAYALFGCTLAPGFDYADYEPGYREELQAAYTSQAGLIAELTRSEFVKRPTSTAVSKTAVPAVQTKVFNPEEVAVITVAPGVELRELLGRVGHAKTDDYSVARFALAKGKGTGTSYNKVGEEVFIILSGHGTVMLGGEATPLVAGTVVVIKPGMHHSLTASGEERLEFYAITFPAFSPEDYVRVE